MGKAKWGKWGGKEGTGQGCHFSAAHCQGKTPSLPGSCTFVLLSSGMSEVPQKPTPAKMHLLHGEEPEAERFLWFALFLSLFLEVSIYRIPGLKVEFQRSSDSK